MTTCADGTEEPEGRGRRTDARATAPRRDEVLLRTAIGAGIAGWAAVAFVVGIAGRTWTLDLQVYRGAGHRLLAGSNPYTAVFTPLHLPFYYPPFAVVVLSPLSLLPLAVTQILWCLVAALAITATIAVGLKALGVERQMRWALALGVGGVSSLLEPVRSGLGLGQVDALLMALVAVDLLAVRGRARGVLIGIASAIKLTPLYFVLYFVVTRDWRALRTSLLSFVAITGAMWALLPAESDRYFLHELPHPDRYHVGGLGSLANQAWSGILNRTPFVGFRGSTVVWLGLCVATTVVVVVLVALLARRRPFQAVVALALGSLLVSPISWSHHWCWLVLLPIVAWERRGERVFLTLCAMILALTASGAYTEFRHGASRSVVSDLLVLLTAALLAWWLRREWTAKPRPVSDNSAAVSSRVASAPVPSAH